MEGDEGAGAEPSHAQAGRQGTVLRFSKVSQMLERLFGRPGERAGPGWLVSGPEGSEELDGRGGFRIILEVGRPWGWRGCR